MELRERIERYFKMTDKEKNDVLVDIIKIYQEQNQYRHNNQKRIQDLIDIDIDIYTNEEEFELVQALTDINNAIKDIETELRNGMQL
jgi:hypothetical protein